MDKLEIYIRKKLGQKVIDGARRSHKRFNFHPYEYDKPIFYVNDDILSLFDEFILYIDGHKFRFSDKDIRLYFIKGSCEFQIEKPEIDFDKFDATYEFYTIEDYTGYGTVDIIKNIILKYSTNYKSILREYDLNLLLKK